METMTQMECRAECAASYEWGQMNA